MEGQTRDPTREAEASCGVGEIRHATAIRVTIGDVVGGGAAKCAMMHHRAETGSSDYPCHNSFQWI